MNKVEKHLDICEVLNKAYESKNSDYGDSFSILRKEFPNAILIRLGDKYQRLKTLKSGKEQRVLGESIKDTLLDIANYCIMEIIEMELEEKEL